MYSGVLGHPVLWSAWLAVWRVGGLSLFLLCLWASVGGAGSTDDASQHASRPEESRPDRPPPVSVQASVDQAEVSIGDRIRYTIAVTAGADVEVEIPLLGDQLGDFTVTDFGELPVQKKADQRVTTRWYTLTIFKTGEHLLPGPTVLYRTPGAEQQRIDGNDVAVTVMSLLAQAEQNQEVQTIRDIKPPEQLPFDWRPYGVLAAVVLAVGGLAAGLFFYLNRPHASGPPPTPPAHEVALEALRRLRAQRLIEKKEFETYYVTLSGIVRAYLEDGLHLRAPEMTTEEFLPVVSQDRRLGTEQREQLSEFLSQADLVKFARHVPGLGEGEAAYEAARRFIEDTRPDKRERERGMTGGTDGSAETGGTGTAQKTGGANAFA